MNLFIYITEILGTIGFAVSGALLAIKKDFDILGIIITGIVAAVGGGFIRDISLGATPPAMFSNPVFAVTAALISLLICIPFVRKFLYQKNMQAIVNTIMDSIGLSVFTVNGILYSSQIFPDNRFLLIFTGVITGVGGGVLRDVLCCERPYIFTKHIYALAALIGAVLCTYLKDIISANFAATIGAVVIFNIRMLAAYFRLKLPHVQNIELS